MTRDTIYTIVVLAVLLPLSAASLAQEIPLGAAPDSGSAYNNKMNRVEVSAPRTDSDLRAAAPVPRQVYGREVLDKYGDSNMATVLRRLPGVDVQDGSVRLRGLGAGYAQILINGEPAPDGFTVDQISPTMVERIEVSKAPTADQSAQAIAGNLNIILRSTHRKRQLDLNVGTSYSEHNPAGNVNYVYGDTTGSVDYSLPLSAYNWRSGERLSINRRAPDAVGAPEHAFQSGNRPLWGYEVNASPQLTWRPSEIDRVSVQTFLQYGHWASNLLLNNEMGSALDLLENPSMNRGQFEYRRISATWYRRLSQSQKLELRGTYGWAHNDFINQNYQDGLPFRFSQGDSYDRTATLAGKFGQLVGENHIIALGFESERRTRSDERTVLVLGTEQLPGVDGLPFEARIDRRAVYLQDEWTPLPQWLVYAGLRHESIETHSSPESGQVDNLNGVLTPLLHLNYTPDSKKQESFRLSLTRTYKAPDLYGLIAVPSLATLYPFPNQPNSELATDKIGNPNLRPELATGLDLSYQRSLAHNGSIDIGIFHRRVKDLIRYVTTLETVSWATVPRWVTRPQNFSEASVNGVELKGTTRVGTVLPWLVDVSHDLVLSGALNIYRSKVDAVPLANNRLDGQQPWSAALGLDYTAATMPLSMGGNFSFTPGYTTQETVQQAVDRSHSRNLDLYGHWKFTPKAGLRLAITNAAGIDGARTTTNGNSWLQVIRKPGTTYSLKFEIKLK